MNAGALKRGGIWIALLVTLYLVATVDPAPEEGEAAPVSAPVRAIANPAQPLQPVAATVPEARRAWSEASHGNPFPVKSWYVPPKEKPVAVTPRAPALPYFYFGKMTEGEITYAYLHLGNKVVIAKAGDVLNGTYRVESIDVDAVKFLYLPLSESQVARMGIKPMPPESDLTNGLPEGVAMSTGLPESYKQEIKANDE